MNIKRFLWVLLLTIVVAPQVHAQSASSTWNDSADFLSPNERSVDIQRAEAQRRAQNGGHSAAGVVMKYEGDVTFNETNQYDGQVTNNNATTAANVNTFSSTVNLKGENNTSGVTFSAGNTANNTTQTASTVSTPADSSNTSNGITTKKRKKRK